MFNSFFTATVVDVNDPLKAGRVTLRIHGRHDNNIEDADLPWAQVLMPNTNASTGSTTESHGLIVGSWVVGANKDSLMQDIVVLGTFRGANDIHPRELGRDGTSIPKEYDDAPSRPSGIPPDSYNTLYPHNKVMATPSGHIVEYDDTPDAERIYIYHRSGSFIEMDASGNIIHRSKGNTIVSSGGNISLDATNISLNGSNISLDASNNVSIRGLSVSITELI